MILGLKIFIFFLSFLLPGYFLMLLFFQRAARGLSGFFAAFGLGSFFVTGQIFLLLFIFRQTFNFFAALAVLAVEIIILYFFLWRKGWRLKVYLSALGNFLKKKNIPAGEKKKADFKNIASGFIVLAFAVNFIFLFSTAVARPTIAYDSLTMWSLKARILFYEKKIDFGDNSFFYLGGGAHRQYPWLLPLEQFWFFSFLGEDNDLMNNLIFVFYFLALTALLFDFIRRRAGNWLGLVFTFFFFSQPLFFYHASNAYADLPLSFYLFLAFSFSYSALESKENKDWLLAGIFSAAALWTKDTAVLFLLPLLASLAIFFGKKRWRELWPFFVIFFGLSAPWIAFKMSYHLDISNVGWQLGFHPEVLTNLWIVFFLSGNWNILWPAIVVILAFNFSQLKENKIFAWGWTFFALALAVIFATYLFTERYLYALDFTSSSRNLMPLVPICIALAALLLSKKEDDKKLSNI